MNIGVFGFLMIIIPPASMLSLDIIDVRQNFCQGRQSSVLCPNEIGD